MQLRMRDKLLTTASSTIFWLSLLIIASPCLAWQTKDQQLAEDFAKMLGFKVKEKVGKVAPEIKPGMVIDGSNYKDYPELKELLTESLYLRLDPKSYAPVPQMKIKETDQYHLGRRWLEESLKSAKTIRIAQDGLTLEGYQGGHAFINPKNGVELIQWADNAYLGDTFAMRPLRLLLHGRDNKPEREMRKQVNVYRYMFCSDWKENENPNPNQVNYVIGGTLIYPRDVSGASYVRRRYLPADKPDELSLYIPSMRRIRRMSGRDTQDPFFGSDLVWDDFNLFWQKLSTVEYPNDYKMLPSREMLMPTFIAYNWPENRESAGYADYYIDQSGDQSYLHFGTWQRRWVHVVELIAKDDTYMYSKRIMVNDPEAHVQVAGDFYDQAGRLFRSWVRDYNLSQDGVGIMEDIVDIVDHVNQHRTIIPMQGHRNPTWMGQEYGDLRFLSRKAK